MFEISIQTVAFLISLSKVYYMLQNRDLVVMIFNIFHKKKFKNLEISNLEI